MWMRLLLCSLIALASAEIARAQSGLGAPIATEQLLTTEYRPQRPVLGGLARTVFPALMPPQLLIETRPIAAPNRDEVARLVADGASLAEISAAKIKLEESQVKSRQAAVRYLALVDCHSYPEAEAGLVAALRTDRNEGVRYEAALALSSCRGPTRRIVDALTVSALGHATDGHPAETSERVRAAAHASLSRVLANGIPGEYLPRVANGPEYVKPLLAPAPQFTEQERRQAETVGMPAKAQPAKESSKLLFPWLQVFTLRQPNSDPRLRGLNPLGAENSLVIPSASGNPSTRRYNDN